MSATDPAVEAAEDHHADLWADLQAATTALIDAAARGDEGAPARPALLDQLHRRVLPHLAAEQTVLYGRARGAGLGALVAALELDHRAMVRLVATVEGASSDLAAALAARSFLLLFALRMEKEERVLLPALAERGIAVGQVVAGLAEVLGEA